MEAKLRSALIDNEELIALLPLGKKAIFHYVAPKTEPKRYPIIVCNPIEDAPVLAGDDIEFAHRLTLKIEVVAKERDTAEEREKFQAVCSLVTKIIRSLGFVRHKSTSSLTDGKIIFTFEFSKIKLC